MNQPIIRRRYDPRRFDLLKWVVVIAVCAVGVFLAVRYFAGPLGETIADDVPAHESVLLNYRINLPSDWKLDDANRRGIRANVALRRSDPPAYLAILAKDYKDRTPRDGELLDEADRRLRAYFSGLEWEKKDDARLAGLRAQRITFQGIADNVLSSGECFILTARGYAYWVVGWMPASVESSATDIVAEWAGIRNGFSLLSAREGWAERAPKQIAFKGTAVPFTLNYTEGLWQKQDPKEFDAAAELALLGRDRTDKYDADKAALFFVLVLPSELNQGRAVAAARAHIEARIRQDHPRAAIEVIAEKDGHKELEVTRTGKLEGRVQKLHCRIPESDWEHFGTFAVVPRPEGNLVLHGDCAWRWRHVWESEFDQLLATLQSRD